MPLRIQELNEADLILVARSDLPGRRIMRSFIKTEGIIICRLLPEHWSLVAAVRAYSTASAYVPLYSGAHDVLKHRHPTRNARQVGSQRSL